MCMTQLSQINLNSPVIQQPHRFGRRGQPLTIIRRSESNRPPAA